MRRIGRATRRIRFSVLAVAALATLLLSAMTCDEEPTATAEPAVAVHEPTPEASATPEPTATPKPTVTLQATATAVSTATPKPTATPEPAATRELVEIEIHRNYGDRPPCSRGRAGIWGGPGPAVMWSPARDEIVFMAGGEVHAIGPDGVGLGRLSDPSDAGAIKTLYVSADGREVVYWTCKTWWGYTTEYTRDKIIRTHVDMHGHALVLASVDGGPVRRLRESGGMEGYPSWSPDGKRIAFVSGSGLHSVAADRTDTRWITTGEIGHHPPQWSPDGKLIAFVNFEASGQRDPAIYVVGAEGRDQHYQRLGDAVSGPAWSPDGQRIAFAKAERDEVGLYTTAVDGTDERRLATIEGWVPHRGQSGPATAWIPTVSWSPDGSKILVLAREADDPEIQIIEADGNGHTTLTVRNPSPEWISDAAWSPDGTRIALSGGFWTGDIALVTIRADGADPLPLVLVWRRADGRLVGRGGPRDDISAQVSACGAGRGRSRPGGESRSGGGLQDAAGGPERHRGSSGIELGREHRNQRVGRGSSRWFAAARAGGRTRRASSDRRDTAGAEQADGVARAGLVVQQAAGRDTAGVGRIEEPAEAQPWRKPSHRRGATGAGRAHESQRVFTGEQPPER